MSGKLLMNFGLLKKYWVLNHRAGSYTQFLGLHRPQRLFRNESDTAPSFLVIDMADVLLSLLLGLPYYADGRTVPISALGGTTEFLQLKLIGLSARVIDKNRMGLILSLQNTHDIQKTWTPRLDRWIKASGISKARLPEERSCGKSIINKSRRSPDIIL